MTTASLPLPSTPPLPDPVEGRGVGGGAGGGRWRRRLRATTTMTTALLPLPLTPPLPDLAEGRGVGGAHGLAAPTIPFQIRPRREGGGGSGHPMQWRSSLARLLALGSACEDPNCCMDRQPQLLLWLFLAASDGRCHGIY
uniref:Uncharacterized protein n=1 Tax=Oryza nivara TaxID=4536 RepID=A0A0E0IMJ5_ORYNI